MNMASPTSSGFSSGESDVSVPWMELAVLLVCALASLALGSTIALPCFAALGIFTALMPVSDPASAARTAVRIGRVLMAVVLVLNLAQNLADVAIAHGLGLGSCFLF